MRQGELLTKYLVHRADDSVCQAHLEGQVRFFGVCKKTNEFTQAKLDLLSFTCIQLIAV